MILESKKVYSYGCAMLYFDFEELKSIHAKIDKDDIYDDEKGYGLENEPHLTLLYGFHSDKIEDKDIFDTILSFDIPNLELYNVSLFENEKYDVLKFDVKQKMEDYSKNEDVLYKINKELTDKFPYSTDYPDYHPHSTIAYLKPGTGKKYVNILKDSTFIVDPVKIVYSKPNDDGSDKIVSHKIIKKIQESFIFSSKIPLFSDYLINENVNASQNDDLRDVARNFCFDVLKLGSKDNIFDQYLVERNLNKDDLDVFIKFVISEMQKYVY